MTVYINKVFKSDVEHNHAPKNILEKLIDWFIKPKVIKFSYTADVEIKGDCCLCEHDIVADNYGVRWVVTSYKYNADDRVSRVGLKTFALHEGDVFEPKTLTYLHSSYGNNCNTRR